MSKIRLSKRELDELANLNLASEDEIVLWLCRFYDKHKLDESLKKAEKILKSTHPIITAIKIQQKKKENQI